MGLAASSVSFESMDVGGAVLLQDGVVPVFLTSYGFSPANMLSFGVIAALSYFSPAFFFGVTDTDYIDVQPVLTFPVIDAGGAASTSVVTCAPFNNGMLPPPESSGVDPVVYITATNQLKCSIPNTSIAPGVVTIAFEKSDGIFFTDASYGFLVADSTILADTVTATNTVFVPGSTVGSTTVTSTRYIFTDEATSTSTTTLSDASSTTYISCSTSTSATNTGTATADPNSTSATDSSSITSATDLSSTTSATDSSNTSSSATDDSSSTTISGTPTAPTYPTDSNPFSSSTSCTNPQTPSPTPQKNIKTVFITDCAKAAKTSAAAAALSARQTTATDTLASNFGAPDFTFSNGDNTATITVTSTAIDTRSTVVTSGTDTSVVTESDTTTTRTVTATVDERTVVTVGGCEGSETAR